MKKILIVLLLNTLILSAFSQYSEQARSTFSNQKKFNVSVMGGYFIGGKIYDGQTTLDIKNMFDYSVNIGMLLKKNYEVELSYIGTNPKAFIIGDNDNNKISLRNNFNFILLGFINYYELQYIHPYYEAAVGTVNMSTRYLSGMNPDYENNQKDYKTSKWMLATAFSLGIKIDVTNNIGIRLQGRLLLPMIFDGIGVGVQFTNGIYPHFSLNSYSILLQGDLSLGAYYKF